MSATAPRLRIATRGSALAMAQARAVGERLRELLGEVEVEIVPIRTQGDRASSRWSRQGFAGAPADPEVAYPAGETVGAFVKELEGAVLEGRCDLAVHSLKDVPTRLPEGLMLAAFVEREDPRDALVLPLRAPWPDHRPDGGDRDGVRRDGSGLLRALPPGARVGTASLRRSVQLRLIRADLRTMPLRGNVETRLRRLDEGRYDAVVLAEAGLIRLGLAARRRATFEPEELVPAAGQGVLAVECRAGDASTLARLKVLDRPELRAEAEAERAFLARTEAGCRWPVGARARVQGRVLELLGFLAQPLGSGWMAARGCRRVELDSAVPGERTEAARRAGEALAEELMARIRAGEGTAVEGVGGM